MPRPVRQPLSVVLVCLAIIVVLGAVVRGSNAVTRFDAEVVADVAGDRSAGVVDVARALTNLGDGLYLGVLLLLAGAALTALRVLRPAVAFAPALSLAAGAALAPTLKAIVERPRPPVGLHEVVERSSGYPSGHSAQAAAGWLALGLVLAYAARRAAPDDDADAEVRRETATAGRGDGSARVAPRRGFLAAAGVIVVVVGVSRVVLGVHSPTDVVAGWLLGLSCALVAVRVLTRPAA